MEPSAPVEYTDSLAAWYEYEAQEIEWVLREWSGENEINVDG